MSRVTRVYGVALPMQDAEVRALCWGSACGKGKISTINLGDGISAIPCTEMICPHAVKESDVLGTLDDPSDGPFQGAEIALRKLKLPTTKRRAKGGGNNG